MSIDFVDAGNRQNIGHNSALTAHLQTVIPQIVYHPVINLFVFGQPFFGNPFGKTFENAFNHVFA